MNPRERVMAALDHREPDMVPIDLGSTENTSIARIAYINLRRHLGMPEDPKPYVINRMMDSVFPAGDLLERLHVDTRPVRPSSAYTPPTREMPEEQSFYDELGIKWRRALYYYDMVEHPYKALTLEEVVKAPMPDPYIPARVEGLREQARALCEDTNYAVVVGHISWGPFELACALRGYEQFLTELATDETLAEALLDKCIELTVGYWDAYLTEVGDYVQVCAQGDDLGMQIGPIISPRMYRKLIKPRHKRLFDFIRSKTSARIFLHSCGSVKALIPDLIEAGVQILSPVQINAAHMEPETLKREFGNDLTFWGGGVDTQRILPMATLDQIRDHVKHNFDVFAPGGGFVFVPVHNIQSDIAPERVMAAYETAFACRSYGSGAVGERKESAPVEPVVAG